MVMVALALSVASATEVAVTVAVPAAAGAVYRPELGSMVPTPLRLQVTPWLEVPETLIKEVKRNCSLVPIVQVGCEKETRMPESRVIVALATALVSWTCAVMVMFGVAVAVPPTPFAGGPAGTPICPPKLPFASCPEEAMMKEPFQPATEFPEMLMVLPGAKFVKSEPP